MKIIEKGSSTSPAGFSAAGIACGLKDSGALDLALLVSDRDCTASGVFTRNEIVAAPVVVDRETLAKNRERLRVIVANSGSANAVTGAQGLADARRMQALAAKSIGCTSEQALVLSTGVIGVPLQMEKIASGIAAAANARTGDGGQQAATAIMTTDTYAKHIAISVALPQGEVIIGGMVKGSGMIHPSMATLLAVITTDAAVTPENLQKLLQDAAERSFNRISVDGDTSTNDTLLLLANGASGIEIDAVSQLEFETALNFVSVELAKMVVRDAEGASKFVTIHIAGVASEADARAIGNTIATSPLVKTAFAGSDPNWGRILAAAGRAGVALNPEKIGLWIAAPDGKPLQLVSMGAPTDFAEADAAAIFARDEFNIQLDFGFGIAGTTIWTCDLTHDYITINADYRT